MIYVFYQWELDIRLYELRCAGTSVKLEPQVFNVLAYLIQHRDHVVPRQELLVRLWPNQFIGDSALERCIMAARKAVGDSGSAQRVIKTLHRRGYRFVAPVQEYRPNPPGMSLTHGTETVRTAMQPHENKLVTVLCSTLANGLTLSEAHGLEAKAHLVDRFFHLALSEVQGCEGSIIQFMIDGFLALFGDSTASEDHALRALQAAVRLQLRLRQYQPDVEESSGRLAARMGLHTGQVVRKRIGTERRMIYIDVADTMQIAVNLQYYTDPCTILISETTYGLIGSKANLEDCLKNYPHGLIFYADQEKIFPLRDM